MSSHRYKRLLKKIENFRGKKRRRISGCSEDGGGEGHSTPSSSTRVWTPKIFGDFSSSNIYNSTSRSPPAELFRKDLISAMKLPDSEPLTPDDYWFISDQWKQEWEKGVQVPVNPDALPEAVVRVKKKEKLNDFKLPKNLIRITQNEFYSPERHHLSNVNTLAENMCRYDLDDYDVNWLSVANKHLNEIGLPQISEDAMEKILEEFESQCYENMQEVIQGETGLGIEYDEDVICDVCRSPDSEEGNEMVFCDSCDICVHQACYGITEIPIGSWICRGCDSGMKPSCVLCPNKGGAMKCTRTGQQWVHVSCALWIPEVSIGCVEKMEPITKLANIPQSRYTLLCCVCKEKTGACIQCSVKACKTAYHVTCGFRSGLEMKAVFAEDEQDEDGVKLRSYCPKHSKNKLSDVENESDDESDKHEKKDEKNARQQKMQEIENGFYNYVEFKAVATKLNLNKDITEYVYYYWKLKRRAAFNKPLLYPRPGHSDDLDQEDGVLTKIKQFVQVRQNLERIRNLCYMVTRREKLSRTWCKLLEETFRQQVKILSDSTLNLSEEEKTSVVHANHGNNVYDRMSVYKTCECQLKDEVLSPDKNNTLSISQDVEKSKKNLSSMRLPNPYAKTYSLNRSYRASKRHGEGSVTDANTSSSQHNMDDDNEKFSESELRISPIRTINFSEIITKTRSPVHESSVVKIESGPSREQEPVSTYPFRSIRTRNRNISPSKSDIIACSNDIHELSKECDTEGNHTVIKSENVDEETHLELSADKKDEDSADNGSWRNTKNRKMKQKVKSSKNISKESMSTKNNCVEEASQFRVKQRQESEKIHESLFSSSQKTRLAGYRIPKKPKNESKTESQNAERESIQEPQLGTVANVQDSLPQPHSSPPKDPRLSSPNFISQNHSLNSHFKLTPQQQQQQVNPHSSRNHVGKSAIPAANSSYPPRLVMKLRKDRNFPESQHKWLRANEVGSNVNTFDFPCEQNDSPSLQGCINANQDSSYLDYARPQGYQVNVRPELAPNDKRRRHFNNNTNNNFTGSKPTRTNIVNPMAVHSIQSTYY